jgi:signal transduction histidine kinase
MSNSLNDDPPSSLPAPVPTPARTLLRWYAAIPPAVIVALLVTAVASVLVLAGSELAFTQIAASQAKLWSLVDGRVSLLKMQDDIVLAESAQRGYLIADDSSYLKPFERASDMATFEHGVLLGKVGEFDKLSKQAISIGGLIKRKQEELVLTVHLAQNGQRAEALAILHTGRGLLLSESIKTASDKLDEMILDETRQLGAQGEHLMWRQRLAVGGLVALNLMFLAALAARTIKHFYQREIQRLTLAEQAGQLEQAVQSRTEELARLSTYLQEQSERERAQLARNLHDEFGALLTAAKLDVSWLQGRNAGDDPQRTERLERLSHELDQAVDLKRLVIESLRPSLLDQLGFSAAVSWHIEETCKRAGLKWELAVEDIVVDADIALTLYRIAQEAMTNTIKYAHATQVWLSVKDMGDAIRMVIRDDGVGMALPAKGQTQHGLQGMRHRVSSHKGTLIITSQPQHGVELRVEIPKKAA